MRLKDLKIGTKLLGGFIIVLVLTGLVGIISYSGISKIVYQLEISKIVNRMIVDAGDAQVNSLRYIIYGDEKYYKIVEEEGENIMALTKEVHDFLLSDSNKKVANNIKEAIEKYSKDNEEFYQLNKEKQEVNKKRAAAALEATKQIIKVIDAATSYSKANKNDYSAVERAFMVQDARNAMNRVRIAANKYVANPSSEYENALKSEIRGINNLLTKAENLMASSLTKKAIKDALEALVIYNNEFNSYKLIVEKQLAIQTDQRDHATYLLTEARSLREGVYDVVGSTKSNAYTYLLLVVIMAIVLGLIIGLVITKNITVSLTKGVNFANAIAAGDLSKKLDVNQKDEIGVLSNALNNMLEKLKEVVTAVTSGSNNITTATQQMSTTSQQLSQGANEQASSVEQVSSTMEEITSNIQQNTDNAQETEKISSAALSDINFVKDKSLTAIEANKVIGNKIQIINDIAFQTNILALNAAVEAARAGEHGKGFAVVAAEVRKLAERSKIAADEIVGIVANSIKANEEAGELLAKTLPNIDKTAKLIQEITAASLEQNNGANQVNSAIQQVNSVTQENAAAAEELASNSEEMAGQAEQLSELVAFFNLNGRMNDSIHLKEYSPENIVAPSKSRHTPIRHKDNGNTKGFNFNLKKDDEFDDQFSSY